MLGNASHASDWKDAVTKPLWNKTAQKYSHEPLNYLSIPGTSFFSLFNWASTTGLPPLLVFPKVTLSCFRFSWSHHYSGTAEVCVAICCSSLTCIQLREQLTQSLTTAAPHSVIYPRNYQQCSLVTSRNIRMLLFATIAQRYHRQEQLTTYHALSVTQFTKQNGHIINNLEEEFEDQQFWLRPALCQEQEASSFKKKKH